VGYQKQITADPNVQLKCLELFFDVGHVTENDMFLVKTIMPDLYELSIEADNVKDF